MRVVTATVQGQKYQIPEMWLVGASQSGMSAADAILYWHAQAQMEIEFNQQHGRAA